MKKRILSKTKLRLQGKGRDVSGNHPKARIEELFPEIPEGLEEILFDVSGEPIFPGDSQPELHIIPPFDIKK